MFVMAMAFSALVSGVKAGLDERIERNRMLKFQSVILKVFHLLEPGKTAPQDIPGLYQDRVQEIRVQDKTVYVGYEADRRAIRGYAFAVGGSGFWGPIEGLAAVDAGATKVLGLAFIRHSETPGLGGRISEPWFTRQFEGLAIVPINGDQKTFFLKPPGSRTRPNDLDAITGASRTSAAVEMFLNHDLDLFLTRLKNALPKG
jgi:Na+-transporting NADH:ubiquinone oxidoreductase subunit C